MDVDPYFIPHYNETGNDLIVDFIAKSAHHPGKSTNGSLPVPLDGLSHKLHVGLTCMTKVRIKVSFLNHTVVCVSRLGMISN